MNTCRKENFNFNLLCYFVKQKQQRERTKKNLPVQHRAYLGIDAKNIRIKVLMVHSLYNWGLGKVTDLEELFQSNCTRRTSTQYENCYILFGKRVGYFLFEESLHKRMAFEASGTSLVTMNFFSPQVVMSQTRHVTDTVNEFILTFVSLDLYSHHQQHSAFNMSISSSNIRIFWFIGMGNFSSLNQM